MANFEFDRIGEDVAVLSRAVRRSAHVQRAKLMLVAACLCTCGVVAVAAALLFHMF